MIESRHLGCYPGKHRLTIKKNKHRGEAELTDSFAVEARHAVKAFGQGDAAVRALDDVSVEIGQSEFFTLLGPSGCGKTTLLRLIAGFETPTRGRSCWTAPISPICPPTGGR